MNEAKAQTQASQQAPMCGSSSNPCDDIHKVPARRFAQFPRTSSSGCATRRGDHTDECDDRWGIVAYEHAEMSSDTPDPEDSDDDEDDHHYGVGEVEDEEQDADDGIPRAPVRVGYIVTNPGGQGAQRLQIRQPYRSACHIRQNIRRWRRRYPC